MQRRDTARAVLLRTSVFIWQAARRRAVGRPVRVPVGGRAGGSDGQDCGGRRAWRECRGPAQAVADAAAGDHLAADGQGVRSVHEHSQRQAARRHRRERPPDVRGRGAAARGVRLLHQARLGRAVRPADVDETGGAEGMGLRARPLNVRPPPPRTAPAHLPSPAAHLPRPWRPALHPHPRRLARSCSGGSDAKGVVPAGTCPPGTCSVAKQRSGVAADFKPSRRGVITCAQRQLSPHSPDPARPACRPGD
jgi:hypothetical protein